MVVLLYRESVVLGSSLGSARKKLDFTSTSSESTFDFPSSEIHLIYTVRMQYLMCSDICTRYQSLTDFISILTL